MNWKLALSGLVVGSLALVAAPGCAVDGSSDADAPAATADELTSAEARLVGTFQLTDESDAAPSFLSIAFRRDGGFYAEIDTGVRCVREPCPTRIHVDGTFRATENVLKLRPLPGEESRYYGEYSYKLVGGTLTLTRGGTLWSGWQNTLKKAPPVCIAPSDCERLNLPHSPCLGAWTCVDQSSCVWECGLPPS